jgi:hypothetical protein
MKNFPHQINDLSKLFDALALLKEMQMQNILLTDENFGLRLVRAEIYTYRDKSLSIDEYLEQESHKVASNIGYFTAARDIRRLFQLLSLIHVTDDKKIIVLAHGLQLLSSISEELRNNLWRSVFLNLGLEGSDGEISHPYRILIKLVQNFPGIETKKLLLALEAENDSYEEFNRISLLVDKDFNDIINEISTTESMAKNAVKILPAIAVQVGDIIRRDNKAFPISTEIVTEDEITTIENNLSGVILNDYRLVNVDNIAIVPNFSEITNSTIDLTSAIRIRQRRLAEHQDIVRSLAQVIHRNGYDLYEGKFDCLSVRDDTALLFEVKTLSESNIDEEKQTVKGVGQIKFYNFSIVRERMGYANISDYLVFSRKPSDLIIRFCRRESIVVLWRIGSEFYYYDDQNNQTLFNP